MSQTIVIILPHLPTLQVSIFGAIFSDSSDENLHNMPTSFPRSTSGYQVAPYWQNAAFAAVYYDDVNDAESLAHVSSIVNNAFGCCFQPDLLFLVQSVSHVRERKSLHGAYFTSILGNTLAISNGNRWK